MSQNSEKKQRGSVNYAWVLAGGYLLYTAVKIFKVLLAGESDAPVVGAIGGVVFVIVGAALLLREWKAYRYGQEHIDDPSSWCLEDDGELLEEDTGTADDKEDA